MNTIIGLRGKGGAGKTTTIGKLFELLKKNGYEIESSSFVAIGIDFKAILFRKRILLELKTTTPMGKFSNTDIKVLSLAVLSLLVASD